MKQKYPAGWNSCYEKDVNTFEFEEIGLAG